MAYQNTFKRYELKYLLTDEQKSRIVSLMMPYMALDQYGRTTIRNLYFDTDNFRLIRRSLERPVYKEKLRLRSYRQISPEDPAFVEIKKKYDRVVYKRRVALPQHQAVAWLGGKTEASPKSQIADLTFTGGYTVVEGPTNSGNGPLDYDRTGTISGGTVLISGSSGMAQSLTTTTEQGILAVNVGSCSAGTTVEIADTFGNTILTLQPEKAFGCVIISTPDIQKGQTYTIRLNGQSAEFEA